MTGDSTQTLPLGTLVRGEKFTRKFRLTDVPATITPTWHWTRKKHQGEVTLTKSTDTLWELQVSIDSKVFEDDGEYSQSLVVTLGEEKRKIKVTFAIARETQALQSPLIIDNTPLPQSPRMVTRRRLILMTRFEGYTLAFMVCILIVTRLIGSSVADSASTFFSNLEIAAVDVGSQAVGLFNPPDVSTTPDVAVVPTIQPTIEAASSPTTAPLTETSIPTVATEIPTIPPTSVVALCPELQPSRLSIGMTGSVTIQSTSALRLRSDASINSSTLYGMTFGTDFIVQNGPVCADGYRWWQIQLTETQTQGWAAENDAVNYFLAPS